MSAGQELMTVKRSKDLLHDLERDIPQEELTKRAEIDNKFNEPEGSQPERNNHVTHS